MWLDTEFNGFCGDLISIALVGEDGNCFYAIREETLTIDIEPWVMEHVMPFLITDEMIDIDYESDEMIRVRLERFLSVYNSVEIIADWPEDVHHMCKLMICGPGMMINSPQQITFMVDRTINAESEVPHNAFYDAMANMEFTLTREIEGV